MNKKDLKLFARELRNYSTPAEIRLWCELLRSRKMRGYQFLRQYRVNWYIVDFACRKLKLVIEVDGYSHNFTQRKDSKRDADLNSLGYTVLRFTNEEVRSQLLSVQRAIEDYMDAFQHTLAPPSRV